MLIYALIHVDFLRRSPCEVKFPAWLVLSNLRFALRKIKYSLDDLHELLQF